MSNNNAQQPDMAKMLEAMTQNLNLGNDFPGKLMQVAQNIAQDIDKDMDKDSPPDMGKMMSATMQKLSGMMQSGELTQTLGAIPENKPVETPKNVPQLNNKHSETKQGETKQGETKQGENEKKKEIEEVEDEVYNETESEANENEPTVKPKTDDLNHTLKVKLEHLYTGRKKKIAYKRSNYKKNADGKLERYEEKKTLVIPILPGTKHGSIITFDQQADKIPGHTPGNVVITIEEIETENTSESQQPHFIRDNDNLLYFQDIFIHENYGLDKEITHLDGKKYQLKTPVGEAIISSNDDDRSNGIRKVVGAGMPIKNTDKFGDLYIRFNLILPEKLEFSEAKKLGEIFKSMNDSETNDSETNDSETNDSENENVLKLERISDDDYYNQFYGYYTDSDIDEYTESEDSEGEEIYDEYDPSDNPIVFFGEDKKVEESKGNETKTPQEETK